MRWLAFFVHVSMKDFRLDEMPDGKKKLIFLK